MRWPAWHWLDDGVLPLTLAGIRVSVQWLWLALFARWLTAADQRALLPLWLMVLLFLSSLLLTRRSLAVAASLSQARRIVALAGLVFILLSIWFQFYRSDYALWNLVWLRVWGREIIIWEQSLPPVALAFGAMIYLWLRGILDGSRRLEHGHFVTAFGLGAVGLVCLILLSGLEGASLPLATAPTVFLFFASAMAGLSLAGLKKARLPQRSDGFVEGLRLNRYWLGSAIAIIVLILGLGFDLSLFLAPEVVYQVTDWSWLILSQLLLLLVKIVSLVLYPILLLLARLIPVLSRLLNNFNGDLLLELEEGQARDPGQPSGVSPLAIDQMPEAVRWLFLVVGLVVIGLAFALVLRRMFQPPADDDPDEKRDYIFSTDLLLAQLAQLWSGLRPGPAIRLSHPLLSLADETDPRRVIRQLYQQLLTGARALDHPRRPAQTPVEYSRDLSHHLPEARDPLELLTDRYLQARYDTDPPTPAQVEAARRAWDQLPDRLRRPTNRPGL